MTNKRHDDSETFDPEEARGVCKFHEPRTAEQNKTSGRVNTIFWIIAISMPVVVALLGVLCTVTWNVQISTSIVAQTVAANTQKILNLETKVEHLEKQLAIHEKDINDVTNFVQFKQMRRQ
jgi:hypothetical protein